jgi:magnesium-transporting ATPase (P-type)
MVADNFYASIVAAIEQGRIIYSNIRKFVYFLLACNVGEILIVFGAMVFGMPMPLRPVQLLWLNLVSDGAPALALGLEQGDRDIMRQPARSPREPVINRQMAVGIAVVGVVDMLAILACLPAMQIHPGHLEAADDGLRDMHVRAVSCVRRPLEIHSVFRSPVLEPLDWCAVAVSFAPFSRSSTCCSWHHFLTPLR